VFIHSFSLHRPYSNPRNHERNVSLEGENDAWERLSPLIWVQEDQDVVDRVAIHPSIYCSQPDPWNNSYQSVFNLLRSLYSLDQVTRLWEESPYTFDLILYIRPDVWFFEPLSLKKDVFPFYDSPLYSHGIGLPSFASHPLNDRFFLCSPFSASLVGHRYKVAFEYSLQFPLHAERFLQWTLHHYGVSIFWLSPSFYFCRVRAHGELHPECHDVLGDITPS